MAMMANISAKSLLIEFDDPATTRLFRWMVESTSHHGVDMTKTHIKASETVRNILSAKDYQTSVKHLDLTLTGILFIKLKTTHDRTVVERIFRGWKVQYAKNQPTSRDITITIKVSKPFLG